MPKALAWLFDTTESNQSEVAELKNLVGTLQQNLVEKELRIAQLDTALQGVNTVLKQVVDAVNAQHQQAPATFAPQTQNPVVPEPVVTTPAPQPAPAPVEVVDELVDLDEVMSGNADLVVSGNADLVTGEQVVAQTAPVVPHPATSPNEQAIQVSAEAIGAGNIDPASYQALDAEINALLG